MCVHVCACLCVHGGVARVCVYVCVYVYVCVLVCMGVWYAYMCARGDGTGLWYMCVGLTP